MTKRQKIITAAVILSVGLLFTQLVPVYLRYQFIMSITLLAYALSIWALWEGLTRTKAILLMILPVTFTLAVASYYFLLPIRWLTRVPVALLFGLSFYTLLLAQNVFNVASIRTIPLYRAASTAAFVLTLVTASLLFNVLFSFQWPFWQNGVAVIAISFPLILQVIWSIEMEGLTSVEVMYSFVISLIMAELAIVFSFWPVSNAIASVLLTTTLYTGLGITTDMLRDRLNSNIIRGYLWAGAVVFVIFCGATVIWWTG